ncbi:MAG: tRNA preQ1(34) S-adenosylmethionine ribosyltransferase-isomerase QueA [Oscillospiraceae bacterium]|jgi:S-adenosylmethionine:tRNA ribosyltransferase-isomerase|nr:tRNA preQ1(34) S-adenosylmethionine ribosyltransferase-isomerase QueA [Oscillospiraceae bacterium]
MKTSDFHFDLPSELIAQTPLERRDASRLMCLDKSSGAVRHGVFRDLPDLLRAGDCMVLNDSRVLPARLFGNLDTGGAVELVLLNDRGNNEWECLARPGRKVRVGRQITFGGGELTAEVTQIVEGGNRLIRFAYDGIFLEALERLGQMPLPPYITETLADSERYQTVYSRETGSAAAPTAGLHFTPELLQRLTERGVELNCVTLHVGLGTFRPVKVERLEEHEMHAEYCEIPAATAEAVTRAKREGRRVIAVGTTSCRTIESRANEDGTLEPYAGFTNCFIYPGYKFRAIDGLVTNFHLPESTLIMLVSALAGREHVLAAYNEAVRERYRFFSFGDAMLIT